MKLIGCTTLLGPSDRSWVRATQITYARLLMVILFAAIEEVKKAAHQSQALVDQMSVNQCLVVDPTSALSRDAERDRLDKRSKDLEEESRRFNEAANRLGKEKTAFEVGERGR